MMRTLTLLTFLALCGAVLAAPTPAAAAAPPIPRADDADGDGLADWVELAIGTDPYNSDTDGDSHGDGLELMAQSDPFDPGSVPAGPSVDHPDTYCCDGLTYAEAAAMHTYPEAFGSAPAPAPAPAAPVTGLPNTGAGPWIDRGGTANPGEIVALGLILALVGTWVVRRRLAAIATERLGNGAEQANVAARSPLRRMLLVVALALVALAAVQGAAGAYPADDYTGDYSEPWWIYADPADDAARQEYESVVRWGEDNPAPHWDGAAQLAEEEYVVSR